jgi:hypothetical protein
MPSFVHRLQDFECAPRQRYTVFATGFHPLRWYRPQRTLKVAFIPVSAKDFAGSRGRKDSEFERERSRGLPGP